MADNPFETLNNIYTKQVEEMINPIPDVPSGQVLCVVDNGNLNWSNMPSNELHPANCPNCGAPLHNGNCEYCGTEVFRI